MSVRSDPAGPDRNRDRASENSGFSLTRIPPGTKKNTISHAQSLYGNKLNWQAWFCCPIQEEKLLLQFLKFLQSYTEFSRCDFILQLLSLWIWWKLVVKELYTNILKLSLCQHHCRYVSFQWVKLLPDATQTSHQWCIRRELSAKASIDSSWCHTNITSMMHKEGNVRKSFCCKASSWWCNTNIKCIRRKCQRKSCFCWESTVYCLSADGKFTVPVEIILLLLIPSLILRKEDNGDKCRSFEGELHVMGMLFLRAPLYVFA